MVVPHGSGSSRAVEVSHAVLKALVGIGSVIVLLLLVLGGAALSRGVSITQRPHARAGEPPARRRDPAHALAARRAARHADHVQSARAGAAGARRSEPHRFRACSRRASAARSGTWSERDSLTASGALGAQALAARDGPGRPDPPRQHPRALGQRSLRLALQPSGPDGRDAVHHADQGLAHQRLRGRARAPDPAHGAPARRHRRRAPMGAEIEAPAAGRRDRGQVGRRLRQHLTIDHGYGIVTRYAHCSKILVGRGAPREARPEASRSSAPPGCPPARTCTTKCG